MGTITMTAKELKNRTEDAFRAIARGERVVLTRRGKTVAVMVPMDFPTRGDEVPLRDESWQVIEDVMATTQPEYASLDEAMSRSRRRP